MSKNKLSKYARKVQRRRLIAKRLNLPSKSPWPVIWAAQYYDRYVAPKGGE